MCECSQSGLQPAHVYSKRDLDDVVQVGQYVTLQLVKSLVQLTSYNEELLRSGMALMFGLVACSDDQAITLSVGFAFYSCSQSCTFS